MKKTDKNPGHLPEFLKIAKRLMKQGDYEGAVNALDMANRLYPENPKIKARFATIYLSQGNIEKAMQYADEAYELDRKSLEANINLGKIYYQKAHEIEGENQDLARKSYAKAAVHFKKVFVYSSHLRPLQIKYRVLTKRAFRDYLRLKPAPVNRAEAEKKYDKGLEKSVRKAMRKLRTDNSGI